MFYNSLYAHMAGKEADPCMVWGTELDMTNVRQALAERNHHSTILLTPAHALIRATALALRKHPEFNARLVGSQISPFSDVNVLVPVQRQNQQVAVQLVRNADQLSCEEIAQEFWGARTQAPAETRAERVLGWLPPFLASCGVRWVFWVSNFTNLSLTRVGAHLGSAPVLVNYLGFRGAPALLSYKPSRLAANCNTLNITLGPTVNRPAVVDGEVVVRPLAGLFVRADHRLVDAVQLAGFTSTLIELLTHPVRLGLVEDDSWSQDASPHEADLAVMAGAGT